MTQQQLIELAPARAEQAHFTTSNEVAQVLLDRATIARARSAIVDVRTAVANSRRAIAETQHLLTLIGGLSVKIDRG